MMPIVHGLQKKYAGRIDFVYLDAGEERTAPARQRFAFTGTPQFVFLDASGRPVGPTLWGVLPEAELVAALDALLK